MKTPRPLSTALGLALLGSLPLVAEATPSFESKPLAAGYMLAAAQQDESAAEGACGEGACGEGMCAASMKSGKDSGDAKAPATGTGSTDTTGRDKHDAEGACGEGKCGKM